MKTIYLLSLSLFIANCKTSENEQPKTQAQKECYKTTYQKTGKIPEPIISIVKTTEGATNGYVDNGGTTFYKIECY